MCGRLRLQEREVNATRFPSHPRVRQGSKTHSSRDCILSSGELSFPEKMSGGLGSHFSGSSREGHLSSRPLKQVCPGVLRAKTVTY